MRSPKAIQNETINVTDLVELNYTVETGVISTGFLNLTNTSSAVATFDVYVNNGVDDVLLKRKKVPANDTLRVLELQDVKLGPAYKVKVQSTSQPYNVFFGVSEISQ